MMLKGSKVSNSNNNQHPLNQNKIKGVIIYKEMKLLKGKTL